MAWNVSLDFQKGQRLVPATFWAACEEIRQACMERAIAKASYLIGSDLMLQPITAPVAGTSTVQIETIIGRLRGFVSRLLNPADGVLSALNSPVLWWNVASWTDPLTWDVRYLWTGASGEVTSYWGYPIKRQNIFELAFGDASTTWRQTLVAGLRITASLLEDCITDLRLVLNRLTICNLHRPTGFGYEPDSAIRDKNFSTPYAYGSTCGSALSGCDGRGWETTQALVYPGDLLHSLVARTASSGSSQYRATLAQEIFAVKTKHPGLLFSPIPSIASPNIRHIWSETRCRGFRQVQNSSSKNGYYPLARGFELEHAVGFTQTLGTFAGRAGYGTVIGSVDIPAGLFVAPTGNETVINELSPLYSADITMSPGQTIWLVTRFVDPDEVTAAASGVCEWAPYPFGAPPGRGIESFSGGDSNTCYLLAYLDGIDGQIQAPQIVEWDMNYGE